VYETNKGIIDINGSSSKLLLVFTREAKLSERISVSCTSYEAFPHIILKLQSAHYENNPCDSDSWNFLNIKHHLKAYKL
jgi:hypothetical protein